MSPATAPAAGPARRPGAQDPGGAPACDDGERWTWDARALSHPGKVRRINEDAFCLHPTRPLWVVADGMGGHSAGDRASGDIARAFAGLAVPGRLSGVADLVETTLTGLNARFRALADYGRQGVTIGSTVAVLAAAADHVLCLWAGDSRIYRSRQGRLELLTQDHSQVEALVALGALLREDMESHPAANVVTRAVGAADALFLDMDYRELADGDRFLLCTDGLTKELPDSAIARILAQDASAQAIGQRLLDLALAGNARDNVTVVVAKASALGKPAGCAT